MRRKITAVLVGGMMVLSTLCFSGCGNSESALASNYVSGSVEEYSYGGTKLGNVNTSWDLKLLEDGSYEMLVSEVIMMSEMAGGVTCYTLYGTYTDGSVSDGYHATELSAPERIVYASYSTMGGYAFDYDSAVDQEFIIPGGDDVPVDYNGFMEGLGVAEPTTVYITQDATGVDTCHFEFEIK